MPGVWACLLLNLGSYVEMSFQGHGWDGAGDSAEEASGCPQQHMIPRKRRASHGGPWGISCSQALMFLVDQGEACAPQSVWEQLSQTQKDYTNLFVFLLPLIL